MIVHWCYTSYDVAWDVVGFLGCKHTFPAHVELLISQHPEILLLKAALNTFSKQCSGNSNRSLVIQNINGFLTHSVTYFAIHTWHTYQLLNYNLKIRCSQLEVTQSNLEAVWLSPHLAIKPNPFSQHLMHKSWIFA